MGNVEPNTEEDVGEHGLERGGVESPMASRGAEAECDIGETHGLSGGD